MELPRPGNCLPQLTPVVVLALVFVFVFVLLRNGIAPAAVVLLLGCAVTFAIKFVRLGAVMRWANP